MGIWVGYSGFGVGGAGMDGVWVGQGSEGRGRLGYAGHRGTVSSRVSTCYY